MSATWDEILRRIKAATGSADDAISMTSLALDDQGQPPVQVARMERFPVSVAEGLGYYVYLLCDPVWPSLLPPSMWRRASAGPS